MGFERDRTMAANVQTPSWAACVLRGRRSARRARLGVARTRAMETASLDRRAGRVYRPRARGASA
eukprot:30845-Pelagococcus_subviridis.AAC.2